MGKTLATQRSLKHLRDHGWTACIVEKFLPARGKMKFPRRIDAFGIGDVLACRTGLLIVPATGLPVQQIALVQTFPLARWHDHRDKILAIPEFHKWKEAGGLVILHGWSFKPKDGIRGAVKRWTLKEEYL
jgi:hypothetical protein